MNRPLAALLCAVLAGSAASACKKSAKLPDVEGSVTMSSGLRYKDLVLGTGAVAETGKMVSMHYTGWLTDGTKFDSSLDRGQPYELPLGGGRVIRGWDEGIVGMKVGGKRKLMIPAELAYGARGMPPVIPPDAPLVFDLELVAVR